MSQLGGMVGQMSNIYMTCFLKFFIQAGWWVDFEDPPLDLQSMGWQGVTGWMVWFVT